VHRACALAGVLALQLVQGAALSQDGTPGQPMDAWALRAPQGGVANPRVVHSTVAGTPGAQVPGLPGVEFGPGNSTVNFDRPHASPGGNWIIVTDTNLPAGEDQVILVNGAVAAREGTATGIVGSTELIGPIDTRVMINDVGDWVYATNTSEVTTADEVIVKVSGGLPTLVARESQAVPGLAGANWGNNLTTPVIDSSGRVGLIGTGVTGPVAGQQSVLHFAGAPLAQSGVSLPLGQLNNEFWENFTLNEFFVSGSGTRWMARGDLTGDAASDAVAVVDGAVVVQEGVVLAGSGYADAVSTISGTTLGPDGRWFVRGSNANSGLDWIYSNGTVYTERGAPAAGDPLETWSDSEFNVTFFMHAADAAGNVVVGGVTNADAARNGLLVLNRRIVVAREGDPIDTDGDGVFDDDAFFNTFGNDDGALTDDGRFYFTATIRDAAGTVFAQGLFLADLVALERVFADSFEPLP
jgi:hypothetical protein